MKKLNPFVAAAMMSAATLFAQETSGEAQKEQEAVELPPVTVTATRVEMPTAKLAQSYTLITSQDIEEARYQSVMDVLRDELSFVPKSYGPYDSNAQISIRAMDSYHTKVLVDGIPFMDNSSTQSFPIIGNLSLYDIDRIEIVKGATSLQGSSAMGGVINIITKRPEEDGIHGRIAVEAGSHERFNTSALILGKYGIADFKLGIGRDTERGISVVANDAYGNVNMDNDVYRSMDYTAGLGIQFTPEWRLEFNTTFQDIDEEYDAGYSYADWMTGEPIVVPDDDNVWVRRNIASGKLVGKDLFNGKLDLSLAYAFTRSDRAYRNRKNTETTYRYIGDTQLLNGQATYHINDWNDLTVGMEYIDECAENISAHIRTMKRSHYTTAGFVGYQVEPVKNLFLALNGRYTDHSEFGDEWTGDASAKYYLEETGTTFRFSMGKGYRSPSVYELYAPANNWGFMGGNPDLKPETNKTWEIGIEQEFLEKKLTVGAGYFENRVQNFIVSTATSYGQISGVAILGAEAFVEAKPIEQLSLKAAYTYQHARDREAVADKHRIAYVPSHKATLNATWYPLEDKKLAVNFGGAWTGTRWNERNADYVTRSKLGDYFLLHTAVSYKLNDNWQLYGRIENLLNTNYTLSDDYGTRYNTYGRCYYVGAVFTF